MFLQVAISIVFRDFKMFFMFFGMFFGTLQKNINGQNHAFGMLFGTLQKNRFFSGIFFGMFFWSVPKNRLFWSGPKSLNQTLLFEVSQKTSPKKPKFF
jgi:hypothetical protein